MPGPEGTSDQEEQNLRQAYLIYYHVAWRGKPYLTDKDDLPLQLKATCTDMIHIQSIGGPDAASETEERPTS